MSLLTRASRSVWAVLLKMLLNLPGRDQKVPSMRIGLLVTLGLTLSTLLVACASEEDRVDVYAPSAGGTDAGGKGGSAGDAGKPSSGGTGGATSTGGSAGQAGQGPNGGAAGQAGEPSNGGAAGASGGAAGTSGGAAGDGGSAGATGGAAGDGGAAGSSAGGSPGSGGSGGAVDCWSTGYSGNCDPLNNDCGGGMACDLMEDWEGYLVLECVSDGPQKAGEACDDENGPYCAERLHCNPAKGVCQKFCCSDNDCAGVGGTCNPIDSNADSLGLCE